MKKFILISAMTMSVNVMAKCPSTLLVKKKGAKTAYRVGSYEKLSNKSLKLINEVGCVPSLKVMTKTEIKALLKSEYEAKLKKLEKGA